MQCAAFEACDGVNDKIEDDEDIICNPFQLRKAKTELQDGFQLSYQPPSLNQLQDGGANLVIITITNINDQHKHQHKQQQQHPHHHHSHHY